MAEKLTPAGLVVGLIPEEQPAPKAAEAPEKEPETKKSAPARKTRQK